MKNSHLYAVILAGGSGTRFWPLSRERFPKQLLHINGDGTLIQQTVRRVLKSVPASRVCLVTNPVLAEALKLQLEDWRDEVFGNFILEPIGRNTAPAIGLAALWLARRHPNAVMLTLPADHIIQQTSRFAQAVSLGVKLAQDGHLVTFGIPPIRPETGYGYIQPNFGDRLRTQRNLSGFTVARFIEKPTLPKAQEYLRKKKYLWNSGIFIWRVETLLEELRHHEPVLFRGLVKVEQMLYAQESETRILNAYKKLKSVSIDYGVMERSSRAAVIPVTFSWFDIGSWANLSDVAPVDQQGNVTIGNVVAVDCKNSVLYGHQQRLIAGIGLSDIVVVDTPDAILICPKTRSQDVKHVVEILKTQGSLVHLEHRTVYRRWGSSTVIDEQKGYTVKRIMVKPGCHVSQQPPVHRKEHWVVIMGMARVTCGTKIFTLHPGQSLDIPIRMDHRLDNTGNVPLEIIEVQHH